MRFGDRSPDCARSVFLSPGSAPAPGTARRVSFWGGTPGADPSAGAGNPTAWSCSSAAARPPHACMATWRRCPHYFRIGCHRRWWRSQVVGPSGQRGTSALPSRCDPYRSAARPQRSRGAHTPERSKRHRGERSALGRRDTAAQPGSRRRDSHENPSSRPKPHDSSARATDQALRQPILRANPPSDHCPRLRPCDPMDTECSAVHPHLAGRPRGHPHGHRRRSRRVDGTRTGPLLQQGLW
jgi:hypothetical protein